MIRTAAYCRVSTDHEDQTSSFEAQRHYFREYIANQPDWTLAEIYADEGITGTSTKKRTEFNRMIADARLGRFDLLLTKEVSRFSRNILDTVAYTRELRSLGIGVIFLNDGIDTRQPDAELRLSILGSIAQEESRRTSQRVKWGQTRRMEQGVVFGRSMLGYDVARGQISVNPEGAEIVKLIFRKYGLERKSAAVIARELTQAGVLDKTWSAGYIVKLLHNEKYIGDLVQKKTYTPDYLTHEKKTNRGQEVKIILRDHHAAIIDRTLWEQVQAELQRRSHAGGSVRHPFSGRIRCGVCGSVFVARKGEDGLVWGCAKAARYGRRGCTVGWRLQDDCAVQMVNAALDTLGLAPVSSEAAGLLAESIAVFAGHRAELTLRYLPQKWIFSIKNTPSAE